jgi:hypothetical protein
MRSTGTLESADAYWPSVFIRGDDALRYAGQLQFLVSMIDQAWVLRMSSSEMAAWADVQELVELLKSSGCGQNT